MGVSSGGWEGVATGGPALVGDRGDHSLGRRRLDRGSWVGAEWEEAQGGGEGGGTAGGRGLAAEIPRQREEGPGRRGCTSGGAPSHRYPSRGGLRREEGKRDGEADLPWRPRGRRRRRGGEEKCWECHQMRDSRGWRGRGPALPGRGEEALPGREGGGVGVQRGRRWPAVARESWLHPSAGAVKADALRRRGSRSGARGDGGAGNASAGGH